MQELPKWKCHKIVGAIKIGSIVSQMIEDPESFSLVPVDQAYEPIQVSKEFRAKHHPRPGGYYVVYSDGYASYSPADAFEDGYTRMEE